MHQDQAPHNLLLPRDAKHSRREALARLLALSASIGLSSLVTPESAGARKKRRKKKRRRRGGIASGGNHGGDKGGGGGNNGGGSGDTPDAEERAFLTLINDHRRANGRGALSLQNQLGAAAERHPQDQADRNRGGHDGSDGSNTDQRNRAHASRVGVLNRRRESPLPGHREGSS